MWEIVWLRSLGVAAGFLGAHTGAWGLGGKHQWCLQMLMWAGQLSTPAVPQGRWFGCLLVVTLPHLAPVDWYTLWLRAVLVANRLIGPNRFIAPGLKIGGGQEKRSWESASRFHHLQLLLRTWSMEIKWGRGEKTEWTVWEISAAASSHMSSHSSNGTTQLCWYLSLYFCLSASPLYSVQRKGPEGIGENCVFGHITRNKDKMRGAEY